MLETESRPLDNSFESAKDVPSAAMTHVKGRKSHSITIH